MRAAGQGEAYLSWAVFAAVVIGGGATMLQALRLGRFGMGHVLMMGSSGAFIAVSIQALAEGGPATLATLVVVAALEPSSLAELREFLGGFATGGGWDEAMAHRLGAVGEEVLLTLLRRDDGDERSERSGAACSCSREKKPVEPFWSSSPRRAREATFRIRLRCSASRRKKPHSSRRCCSGFSVISRLRFATSNTTGWTS